MLEVMKLPLFDQDTATRPRQLLSWALLAGAAGAVNATAFLACARFVTHVTGIVTRVGLDVGDLSLMLEYLLVLGCFVVGAMVSVAAMQARTLRGRPPALGGVLAAVAALLALAALLGWAGAFGAFGGTAEQPADFALLSLLGFTMGLQNAAVASATAIGVRTTHMTGPASDLGVHLGSALASAGDPLARALALRLAAVRATKLLAFIVGAALAVPLARAAGYLALLVPALLVALTAGVLIHVKGAIDERSSNLCGASARAA